ncbi:MAG: hypothetical protein SFW67_14820 [Myxococcaceae bacterium]|nr:hypothetical protein [Myxococcaceae bacterium]
MKIDAMRVVVAGLFAVSAACFAPAIEQSGADGGSGAGSSGEGGEICPSVAIVDPGDSVQPAGACLCTRRDDVPNGRCPRGVGESASAVIGPAGGSVALNGQQARASGVAFTITFPTMALSTPTTITVTETRIRPPTGFVDWSPVFRIDPVGLVLNEPAQVLVPFSQGRGTAIGGGELFWSTDKPCTLARLPSSSMNAGFNNGNVGRLGYVLSGVARLGTAEYCQ